MRAVRQDEPSECQLQLTRGDHVKLRLRDVSTGQLEEVMFRFAGVVKEFPTAQMLVAETADTETRSLPDDATFGLGTTLQLVPSQCSISV